MLDKLYAINTSLTRRFPDGNSIFEIMTRLLEECGELAVQVNIFEDRGIKRQKHGEPDPTKMAKEIQDVLRSALAVAQHYGLEDELAASVERSYRGLKEAD